MPSTSSTAGHDTGVMQIRRERVRLETARHEIDGIRQRALAGRHARRPSVMNTWRSPRAT